jgi:hypothetical protein
MVSAPNAANASASINSITPALSAAIRFNCPPPLSFSCDLGILTASYWMEEIL